MSAPPGKPAGNSGADAVDAAPEGLIHAKLLDGHGGASDLDWQQVADWQPEAGSPEAKLADYLEDHKHTDTLVHYEIEDKFFEHRLATFAGKHGLKTKELNSPMFLTTVG